MLVLVCYYVNCFSDDCFRFFADQLSDPFPLGIDADTRFVAIWIRMEKQKVLQVLAKPFWWKLRVSTT